MNLGIDTSDRRPAKDRLAEVADEVSRLRKSNTRLTVLAILGPVLAIGLSAVLVVQGRVDRPVNGAGDGLTTFGIIEARGLIIRDETGEVRATLGYDKDSSSTLKLHHKGEVWSEYRVLFNGMPSIGMKNSGGGEALFLAVAGEGDPSIDMLDRKGDLRSHLGLSDGDPSLTMHYKKTRSRYQVGIYSDGIPFMDFFDQRDKVLPMLDKAGLPLTGR